MQIVIDIPEEVYNEAITDYKMNLTYFEKFIADGTPLPKGHGKLKDADALILNNKDYIVTTADLESEVRNEMVEWINEDIENAPTIIEADKTESEEH